MKSNKELVFSDAIIGFILLFILIKVFFIWFYSGEDKEINNFYNSGKNIICNDVIVNNRNSNIIDLIPNLKVQMIDDSTKTYDLSKCVYN